MICVRSDVCLCLSVRLVVCSCVVVPVVIVLSVELVANKVICRDRRKQTSHPMQRHHLFPCLLSRLVPFEVSCQPDRVKETMWQLEEPLIPNYSCHKGLVFQDKSGLVLSPFILNGAGQSILSHKGRTILP